MNFSPKTKDYIFLASMTLAIFTITYTILLIFGLTPHEFAGSGNIFQVNAPSETEYKQIIKNTDKNFIPQKIEIPKIGVSSTVQFPSSITVATLDAALAKGAVYYPGSGTLQAGNMFLFGHSTNWKVVNNQAYKTFNDLDKLTAGDEIVLTSGGKQYIYSVLSVRHAPDNDVRVNFNTAGRTLTISTCDTFGQKQDRWVVDAEFKETR
jgi:LPXTG-site transpeptidase (sortase) family protein